jgi:sulfite reductase (ferredoxin)
VSDADHFNDADKNLIKFHGSYQQEDRDARKTRRADGLGKFHIFMVRCKIPGGRLTAEQYLGVDDLAGKYANGTIRLTSRQGIQLHGVLMGDLRSTIKGINDCLLTTLGACGDVERNVMAPPAPLASPVYRELQETAARLASHLAPRTKAYHEIWLNGERVDGNEELVDEPIYGKVYLPRKFKTGLALPEDNSVDVYAQDLGLLALTERGKIHGYNVLVGGGMGMTHGNDKTFPYIARPICHVAAADVVTAAEAVVKLFRDHGNRADRKRRGSSISFTTGASSRSARCFRAICRSLQLPRAVEVSGFPLHLGWNAQGDGKFWYGVSVENGRIRTRAVSECGPASARSWSGSGHTSA